MEKKITITSKENGQIVFDFENINMAEANGLLYIANTYINESLKESVTANFRKDKIENNEIKSDRSIEDTIEQVVRWSDSISVRLYNVLMSTYNGVKGLKIKEISPNRLLKIRNFGKHSLKEYNELISDYLK